MGQSLNLRVTPSFICECPLSRHPAAALAAVLFQELHITNDHAAVDRLAHVVDGEQGHLHGSQGFNKINNLAATGWEALTRFLSS